MGRHLLRRLIGTGLVLLAVSFITFVALAAAPGDAAVGMVGESASQEQLATVRREMGLDASLLERYCRFMADLLLRGDLGKSLVSRQPVSSLLLARLPYTLLLAVSAVGLASVAGMLLGTLAALRTGTYLDAAIMGGTVLGLALPTFWSGLLLIMVFSLRLRWLPVVGADSLKHLILPTLTLALPTTAIVARLVRSSLLDVMSAEYVRTAHAKGLAWRQVFSGHILRNSLIPLLTVLGMQLGHIMGGAFIVETIFSWPGLGRLAVQAIFDRDDPVVLGAALTMAAAYLLSNFLVDLAQSWLDPRVAHEAI
jgi:ABC-type dipeptide/oligopeptide/nickel transport system permease component